MLIRTIIRLALAFFVSASAATALAGPILIIEGDHLLGASGVNVGGKLYNVEFLDGTCVSVFSGCDSLSDFTFHSFSTAQQAAQVLLDTVFFDGPLGDFDSDPELTRGCTFAPNACEVFTPYGFSPFPGNAFFTVLNNFSIASAVEDSIGSTAFEIGVVPAGGSPRGSSSTFARWSAVPEPSILVLMGAGLAALGIVRRKSSNRHLL